MDMYGWASKVHIVISSGISFQLYNNTLYCGEIHRVIMKEPNQYLVAGLYAVCVLFSSVLYGDGV